MRREGEREKHCKYVSKFPIFVNQDTDFMRMNSKTKPNSTKIQIQFHNPHNIIQQNQSAAPNNYDQTPIIIIINNQIVIHLIKSYRKMLVKFPHLRTHIIMHHFWVSIKVQEENQCNSLFKYYVVNNSFYTLSA